MQLGYGQLSGCFGDGGLFLSTKFRLFNEHQLNDEALLHTKIKVVEGT